MKKFVILFGPPGSGKSTQVEKLEELLKLPVISPGVLFRQEIEKGTEFGKRIEPVVESGQLVDDRTVEEIIELKLRSEDSEKGAIFNGYPRRLEQQEFLLKIFEDIKKDEDKLFVALIDVDDELIKERLGGRRVCDCGATYHIKYNPPRIDGICDDCGKELYIRPDDKLEVIEERLAVYHDEAGPMLEYWEQAGMLTKINGGQEIEAVYAELLEELTKARIINQ